jgi:hypothetical protein
MGNTLHVRARSSNRGKKHWLLSVQIRTCEKKYLCNSYIISVRAPTRELTRLTFLLKNRCMLDEQLVPELLKASFGHPFESVYRMVSRPSLSNLGLSRTPSSSLRANTAVRRSEGDPRRRAEVGLMSMSTKLCLSVSFSITISRNSLAMLPIAFGVDFRLEKWNGTISPFKQRESRKPKTAPRTARCS